MLSSTLKIRGNLDEFLHTGALLMTIVWFMVSAILFFINKGAPEQIEMQKAVATLFLSILAIVAFGILLQTITVDDKHVNYSSNFLPIIKRKILISDISRIVFGRSYSPLIDPTPFSKLIMAKTDQPIVGLVFYNRQNEVLGGINTKVYKESDIRLVINKIKDINPSIQGK